MQSVRQYGRIACRRRDVHRPGGKQNRQRDPLRLQPLTQSRQRRQTCRDVRFIVVIRVLRPLGAAPVGVEQPPHLLTVAPVQHAAAFPAPQRQIQRCRKADALVPQGELVGAVIREGGSEGAVQTAGERRSRQLSERPVLVLGHGTVRQYPEGDAEAGQKSHEQHADQNIQLSFHVRTPQKLKYRNGL